MYLPTQQSYSDKNMKNFITLKEGKPNLTNDYKLIKLLEGYENDIPELKIVIHAKEIKHTRQIESKTYVLHIDISNTGKDAREKVQIKLNLEKILRKIQKTKKSIKKELQYFEDENGNKVPRVRLCFDTQYYFAAGAGRFIKDYKEILDKYKKEIYLIHINNVIKERKFQQQSGTWAVMKPTTITSRNIQNDNETP
ncbi:18146_t:CDS:2 [Racocetra persica]|uniref:18146_t:CDS:1 n=1 Tax=Racocetra persica TaxID=160502 RepID=A0ACA9N4M0_9GLOM|nr:18146_t:CDS:2 [Racocetra persica]